MALPLTSHPSSIFRNPNIHRLHSIRSPTSIFSTNPSFSSVRFYSTGEQRNPDPFSRKSPARQRSKIGDSDEISVEYSRESTAEEKSDGISEGIEKTEPAKLSDSDLPKDEDEWGGDEGSNGKSGAFDKLGDLKMCLVDTVYGTEFGFRATAEVRAEVLELVNQLELENPTPAPTEAASLLDGNWVLLYTAFSELLPLLAAGTIPLLKVERICQAIDTRNLTIVNSSTLSGPFATFTFSASATFEVQSPSRIQVQFNEGILQPPEIKSSLDLPENLDVLGQKINLSPVQQTLNPLQEAFANISRGISSQPPFKVPIPGDRSSSWLLITYLDENLLISRGDGGLFVLAKEGSPLLDQ